MRALPFAIAAALLIGAAPASAAVRFNITGVIVSGFDNGYVFPGQGSPFGIINRVNLDTGETFGDATGRPFSLLITLDESKGTPILQPNLVGREGNGANNPATADFTLNGVTLRLSDNEFPSSSGYVAKTNEATRDTFSTGFDVTRLRPPIDGPFVNQMSSFDLGFVLPISTFNSLALSEPGQWVRTGAELASGNVRITLQNTDGFTDRYISGQTRSALLTLRLDSLTVTSDPIVTPPGAVPEPGAWALMILGFGVVGAALRRRPVAGALG